MTDKFEIQNTISGTILGVYEGEDAEAALLAMHREAGYSSAEAAEEAAPTQPGTATAFGPARSGMTY